MNCLKYRTLFYSWSAPGGCHSLESWGHSSAGFRAVDSSHAQRSRSVEVECKMPCGLYFVKLGVSVCPSIFSAQISVKLQKIRRTDSWTAKWKIKRKPNQVLSEFSAHNEAHLQTDRVRCNLNVHNGRSHLKGFHIWYGIVLKRLFHMHYAMTRVAGDGNAIQKCRSSPVECPLSTSFGTHHNDVDKIDR